VRAADGLCIADEVQTGFGRTGSNYWGFQNQVGLFLCLSVNVCVCVCMCVQFPVCCAGMHGAHCAY